MNYYANPTPQWNPPPMQPQPNYYMPPNPLFKPIRRSANIACLSLIIVVLIAVFLSPIFSALEGFFVMQLEIKSPQAVSLITNLCELTVYMLMLIVPMTIMRLWIGIPARVAFPMRRPRATIAFPAILVCLGVSVVGMTTYGIITTFLESAFGVSPILPDFPDPIGVPATIVYMLRVAAAPAILEEFLFRGVIMQSLRRFGDFFALVCSSILFSFAHHNLVQGPNALMLGFAIGFFVLRTGSLRTGILIHFVNNLLSVIIDFLSRDLAVKQAEMLTMFVFGFYIICGLVGFALLQFHHGGTFALARSDYPVQEKKKYSLFFFTAMPIIYAISVVVITITQFE